MLVNITEALGQRSPIRFDYFITGPQGARFILFPEAHHSKDDIDHAKSYLRISFDVVSINVVKSGELWQSAIKAQII